MYFGAHSYVAHEIIEIADLPATATRFPSRHNRSAKKRNVVGVRFMAETVKILSPEKKVILAQPISRLPDGRANG